MSTSEIIGSLGVTLLLIAFFMNSFAMLDSDSRVYQTMNAVGAAISCYASYLIGFMPFVVLEAFWCVAAVAAMLRGRAPAANS
ncbi:MAG: CBU_0592 family membrane protein [Candidatus Binatus sp.]